jgi:hypothetical protein
MPSYITRMLLFVALLFTASGCNSSLMNHSAFDSIRPNPNDYREASDDPGSEWDFVGDEGRADQQAVVEDGDQWFKKYLMSPRARSIERNLGFE